MAGDDLDGVTRGRGEDEDCSEEEEESQHFLY